MSADYEFPDVRTSIHTSAPKTWTVVVWKHERRVDSRIARSEATAFRLAQELAAFWSDARPRRPAIDDALGIAWWNGMTKIERLAALDAAATAVPAEAWAFWRLQQSVVGP